MAYSEQQLEQAGRQLATAINDIKARLDAVEGRPGLEKANADWQAGRQIARAKGYSDSEIDQLENQMVSRGILNHSDAVRLDLLGPRSPQQLLLGGLKKDEMDALMSGDFDGFERLAVPRALAGE